MIYAVDDLIVKSKRGRVLVLRFGLSYVEIHMGS